MRHKLNPWFQLRAGFQCWASGGKCAWCRVRAKRLLGIKNIDVYAMALYVDADGARGVLAHKFRGAAPDQLAKNQQLFDGEWCSYLRFIN